MLGTLLAALIVAMGGAGLARWSAGLLQAERAQQQRLAATEALQMAQELGSVTAVPGAAAAAAGPALHATATLVLADGSILTLEEQRLHDPGGSDPLRGVHVQWAARWVDAHGHPQHLGLRSYWAPLRRIY